VDDRVHYQLWVSSISYDVGAVNNNYHPKDYHLAIERYQLYCRNPEVRVAKITMTLYLANGDTETILIKRHEKK